MVYVVEGDREAPPPVRRLLDLQVDNSLELGWAAPEILLLTSFPYERRGVTAVELPPADRPRTARLTSFHKTRAILRALELVPAGEPIWYHDADAFQLVPIAASPARRQLAFCLYTTRERMLVQGGSLFFTDAARPLFEEVLERLVRHGCRKDEFALTDLTRLARFAGWFEALDYSYNLGSTDFELRYQLAEQPIKVVHFHLDRPEHRALFLGGRNGLGAAPVGERFRALMAAHGFDVSYPADLPVDTMPQYRSTGALARWFERLRGGSR